MFKWLADMIVKTPVQGTCSCCEGKKERLKKMQEAIMSGEEGNESDLNLVSSEEDSCGCGGGSCGISSRETHEHECRCKGEGHHHGDGECHCGGHGNGECCGGHGGGECQCRKEKASAPAQFSSASYSVSYQFDQAQGRYRRTVGGSTEQSEEN